MMVKASDTGLGNARQRTGAFLLVHGSPGIRPLARAAGASREEPSIKIASVVNDCAAESNKWRAITGEALLFEGAFRVPEIIGCCWGPQPSMC
jgi:hypothetical protein